MPATLLQNLTRNAATITAQPARLTSVRTWFQAVHADAQYRDRPAGPGGRPKRSSPSSAATTTRCDEDVLGEDVFAAHKCAQSLDTLGLPFPRDLA
jgi:hypothetical protein